MNWKLKALIIWLLAVPAFTGFPINYMTGSVLPGIDSGWILYGIVVYAAIIVLLGRKLWVVSIIIALAVAVPLVVLGTLISFAGLFITGWNSSGFAGIIYHYAALAAKMIVVIPLALAMVTVLPFHRLESRILQSRHGVSIGRKIALMFLRVFSHIFYFVIPNILEVVREEGVLPGRKRETKNGHKTRLPLRKRLRTIVRMLVNIGVESICSAIRFIPLWAEEISMLPGKRKSNKMINNQEASDG